MPEHDEFWLYPTAVHQAQQGLRTASPAPPSSRAGPDGSIAIRALARVEMIGYLGDESRLPALEEFHVLTEETVRKRFRYRTPGLWILVARIWRRSGLCDHGNSGTCRVQDLGHSRSGPADFRPRTRGGRWDLDRTPPAAQVGPRAATPWNDPGMRCSPLDDTVTGLSTPRESTAGSGP